jgi:hypothetical protein
MKVQFRLLFPFALFFSAFSLLFFSCKPDPIEVAKTRYEQGIFIVNEGPFNTGTGTLTYYNPDSNIVVQDVFGKENNDASLGNVLQSMTIHNDKAYCVLNNAKRIIVLDAKTMTYLDTIGGLNLPRYFLGISNTKAYVSQYGADGLNGSIEVVDLVTNKITKSIALGGVGADRMLKAPNSSIVYCVDDGGFGSSDKVFEIKSETDEIRENYVIGYNPNSLVWDPKTKSVATLCGGQWTYINPNIDPGRFAFVPSATTNSVLVQNGAKDLNVNADGSTFYYTDGSAVYALKSDGATLKLFDQSCYGLFFDAKNELFYCTDAKDFVSTGELVIRKLDGTIVRTIPTGITPGEVIFR